MLTNHTECGTEAGYVTSAGSERRIVILAEGQFGPHHGKTAMGVIRSIYKDLVTAAREVAFALVDSSHGGLADHPELAAEIRALVDEEDRDFLFKS